VATLPTPWDSGDDHGMDFSPFPASEGQPYDDAPPRGKRAESRHTCRCCRAPADLPAHRLLTARRKAGPSFRDQCPPCAVVFCGRGCPQRHLAKRKDARPGNRMGQRPHAYVLNGGLWIGLGHPPENGLVDQSRMTKAHKAAVAPGFHTSFSQTYSSITGSSS
jgi:hypothetical protein